MSTKNSSNSLSPAASAIASREAVRGGIERIYRAQGREMPPKASLLELLADTPVREFIADDDRLRDLKPLAVIEAKKTTVGPEKGRQQVKLYGECLEKKYGYTPIL